jgi:uncharacterized protein
MRLQRDNASVAQGRILNTRHRLKFRRMPGTYAIVRRASDSVVPDWAVEGDFSSVTRTSDELSIVCSAANVPADVPSPQRWVCFKLEGPFPFSLTGVLLSFIEPLSANEVPIFATSTYDTDYVLVQEESATSAMGALRDAGHELLGDD